MTETQDKLAGLSPERREAVLRLLKEASKDKDIGPTPRRRSGPVPLSSSQNTLWLVDRIDPGRASYNVPFCFKLAGRLDREALQQALSTLINRHEALRTYVLVEGENYLQGIIAPDVTVTFDEHLAASSREAEALVTSFAQRGFDLTQPFLWRAHLVTVSDEETWFVFNVHHIIFDGWSASVFQPELAKLYAAYVTGTQADLGEDPLQFADFSEWQRETFVDERAAEHADYWRTQFEGYENLDVPTDRPLPIEVTYDGTFVAVTLPQLMSGAQQVARAHGTSAFTVYVAAFAVLMHKYTGQDDIVFGSPNANRNYPSVESTIGFFINMMPLRIDMSGDPTFEEVLRRVDMTTKEARVHSEMPFEQIVAAVRPARDPSRSAIFQVAMTMQDASGKPLELLGLQVEPVWLDPKSSRFQMSWNFLQHPSDLEINIELNTAIFDTSTVETMARRFGHIFRDLTTAATTPVSALSLLDDDQRAAEIQAGVGSVRERSSGTVVSRFVGQARQRPDDLAVMAGDDRHTYGQVMARAASISRRLAAGGVGRGDRVGVLTDRNADLPASVIAVMALGAIYVPLDPGNPALRNVEIIEDAQLSYVVGHRAHVDPVLSRVPASASVEVLPLEAVDDDVHDGALEDRASEDEPAYLLYTSGSTGRPKGVIVTHHNVANFVDNVAELFEMTPRDQVLGFASVGFDVSIFEMLSALMTGASVHLVPHDDRLDIDALQRFIREHAITITDLPPSVMSLLDPSEFDDLRIVFVGGEAFSGELVDLWATNRRFFNGYGPTECTVTMVVYECARGSGEWSPPIGLAMTNHVAHVVDENLQVVAPGIPGELAVGGDGLAQGYWNRPQQNAEAFVVNPFGTTADGRLYRTGDIVRRNADGQLVYLGRRDGQVKINGVRIELGEIEARLRQIETVRQATVVPWVDDNGRKHLVGYVVTNDGVDANPTDLRRAVGQHLIPAMVPSYIVSLPELPLTRSGKIDRSRLPAPELDGGASDVTAPRTETEQRLVEEVYLPLLGLDSIDIRQGFFEAGGSSLQAAQLLSRIRKLFEIEIPLTKFFRDSSVETMALRIDRARAAQMDPEDLVALLAGMSDSEAERLLAGE